MLKFKHAGRHETKLLLLIFTCCFLEQGWKTKKTKQQLQLSWFCATSTFCAENWSWVFLLFWCVFSFDFIIHSDAFEKKKSTYIYIYMLFTGFYKHVCMTACTQSPPPPLLSPVKHELGKVPALFFLRSWWQMTKLFWPFLVCNWFKDHVLCLLKEIWKSFELDPGGFFANRWTEEEFRLHLKANVGSWRKVTSSS